MDRSRFMQMVRDAVGARDVTAVLGAYASTTDWQVPPTGDRVDARTWVVCLNDYPLCVVGTQEEANAVREALNNPDQFFHVHHHLVVDRRSIAAECEQLRNLARELTRERNDAVAERAVLLEEVKRLRAAS